jgi:antitoxin component of RelBE/YafQ-DinJ toxin-antitoxin module
MLICDVGVGSMASNKPKMIRMNEDTIKKGEEQAEKLGLNISEYIRLIINLDAATGIIEKLRESE